jgi:FkbM family methyltransferase
MSAFKSTTIKVLDVVLPDRIKNSILHLGFNLAPAEFERFAYKFNFAPHMELGLVEMASRGFAPMTIVDVGAFEGGWSRIARRTWPGSKLMMIEPNRAKRSGLVDVAKELDANLICELLGAESGGTVTFNVMGTGSSIMSERSAVPRATEVRRLCTLDSLLLDVRPPGLLKIDAQGYELEVLRGASRVLSSFEAVLLEIAVIEINEGAPLLHEVIVFMKAAGFVTYDILEIHRRPLDRALNQVDIIFVREQSGLIADKRHFSEKSALVA